MVSELFNCPCVSLVQNEKEIRLLDADNFYKVVEGSWHNKVKNRNDGIGSVGDIMFWDVIRFKKKLML